MTRLEIVADQGRRLPGTAQMTPHETARPPKPAAAIRRLGFSLAAGLLAAPARLSAAMHRVVARSRRRLRALGGDEAGAVTAEYAIVIMAAVILGGVLVTIVRSPEIREQLTSVISSAFAEDA